jgi:hypothetical protein
MKESVKEFVQMGCADDPDGEGCDILFMGASGIVNRGSHDTEAHNLANLLSSDRLYLNCYIISYSYSQV